MIEWMIQKARPYIYSTASSPAIAFALLESLRIIEGEIGQVLRSTLKTNISQWKKHSQFKTLKKLDSDTAIQPIVVGSNEAALQLAKNLDELGYWIPAIRPPTVPKNMARLRMTLSAAHTSDEIITLSDTLKKLESQLTH
jgi:8-amino-7-oxononanoate synthase